MHEISQETSQVVALHENMLKDLGYPLSKDSLILDFGCGSGRHVYEYLDKGYANAFGYDQGNYAHLRQPEDQKRFLFSDKAQIPLPDNSFDFIYSCTVFEHVFDPKKAFQEIYRVLKPGGVSIHYFPAKLRPIEAHIHVPFGGVFKSYPYFLFWAMLGIRNQFQRDSSAEDTAKANYHFAQTGIYYLSKAEIDKIARDVFDRVDYIETCFLKNSSSQLSKLLVKALPFAPFIPELYRTFHTKVLFLKKKAITRVSVEV
ncbi:class I SAM-dependent methyltransferase [Candidatus Nucleicultrix amoebiphila]|jgi:SAM-dependent methyltransferase|uniref:Methyltransferase type 11 domain-containing protein n=1 Tax=Candidatus Nucleicultrix amoebiphila FS5 TaxID=1414854 RepID=A0A1W6N5D4_9PROT|nr:class I SAM-dependent methyltransferase [Candidatus Nucleicultrix amoebiphila]ARN84986.1 hypothetical protein GQ61_06450 [Candidatus Nucleicultrix amoebiphila FS5]